MNVYLLANMATQYGAGTQTPRIKRVDLRSPFQVFFYNHLVDGNEMPFRPETSECKTSEERSRCLRGVQ